MKLLHVVRDVLVVGAMTILGFIVVAEAKPRHTAATPVRIIPNWRDIASGGNRVGSDTAKVTITEFSDFQCPYCRALSATLAAVMSDYAGTVAIVFRHYPIVSVHPYAERAALASECAAAQGRWVQFHNVLFKQQDLIGSLPWTVIAQRAGVPDTARLARCIVAQQLLARIRADEAAGAALGVTGTPTVLVNELELPGTPDRATLDSAIRVVQIRRAK